MAQVLFSILFATGVILGGKNIVKRWRHIRRMRKNAQLKRKTMEKRNRQLRFMQEDVEAFRRDTESKRDKRLKIICKNPQIASVWQ